MADEVRTISINVQATRAIQSLTKMSINLDEMTRAVGSSDANLKKIDRTMAASQKTAFAAAQTLAKLKTEYKLLGKELTVSNNSIKALEGRLNTANKRLAQQKVINEDLRKSIKGLTRDNTDLAKQNAKLAGSFAGVVTGANSTKKAVKDLNDSFQENALRYALYDVANSFRVMRDVGVGALSDLLKTGIAFEKGFANVIRTSQVSNPDLFKDTAAATRFLRNEFLDLQSSLPVTAEELARIGTLAAQMGVAASEVSNFTEVTAKFAATSGISAEEAATSLSRIGQMLAGDVQGDYERLASAILKTGVNAIATEQQIVRGTTQIASVGKVAGLSAQEIIALSSAMSSLGMSPELQRSIITSSFTKILTAVRGSTAEAEKFGSVLGMTGREFQAAWEGDGYNTYRKLLAAIAESPNAIGLLKDLGLASQRLTPNLLKMGQAYDLLGDTLEDTNKGWEDASELQRQYDEIAKTTAARLQVLSQAWDAFLTVIGSDAVSAVGDLAKWLTDVMKVLREFAQTPIGGALTTLVIGFTAFTTAVLALLTAIALGGAGLLGFDFVMKQLAATSATTTGLMVGQTAVMNAFAITTKSARIAVIALNGALKILGPLLAGGAIVGGAIAISPGLEQFIRDVQGLDSSTNARVKELMGTLQQGLGSTSKQFASIPFDILPDLAIQLNRSVGDNGVWGDIKHVDESLRDLVQKGNVKEAMATLDELRASWIKEGGSDAQFNLAFTDTNEALALTAQNLGVARDDLEEYYHGVEAATTSEEKQAIAISSIASALGLVTNEYVSAEDALKNFASAVQGGMEGFFDFGDMLEQAYGTDEGQGGGLARLQEDLDNNLVAAETWADGLQTLITRGASTLATEFAKQGPESQQAVTDALALGPDALSRLEQSMADAALFASEAYANAFASETGILADVYKKMLEVNPEDALNAVHSVRDAIRNNGGILDAETLAGLQSQYGFKLDIGLTPEIDKDELDTKMLLLQGELDSRMITVPFTTKGPGGEPLELEYQRWIVTMEGHQIVLPVDPNTEEGTRLLTEWRLNEYETPVALSTRADTSGAEKDLNAFTNQLRVINIQAKLRTTGGAIDPGGNLYPGAKTGGMAVNGQIARRNYPGYANGTVLRGPGSGTSDSILARVSNGEAITRAAAVRHYGSSFFEDLNRMRIPKYATGAIVGTPSSSGGSTVVNATVNQYYPTSQDPIKKLKEDAESVIAGIWT